MSFPGTLVGLLRGKPHHFQMEWVDLDKGFVVVNGGYEVTSIEGGKPYLVIISKEQMELFAQHSSLRVRVKALRALAHSKKNAVEALMKWLRCE